MVRRILNHELLALLPEILLVDSGEDAKRNTKAHRSLLNFPVVKTL